MNDDAQNNSAKLSVEDSPDAHTPTTVPATDAPKQEPKHSPYKLKYFIGSALLGILLGIALFYPILIARNWVTNYFERQKQTQLYGQELPAEMRPITQGFKDLYQEFYRELSPLELYNGAIIGINAAYDDAQAKKDKKDKEDKKAGASDTASPSPTPSTSPSASPSPDASATPMSLAQAYQEYAHLAAEALRDKKTELKMIYPLIEDKGQNPEALEKEFNAIVLKAINERLLPADKLCYGALCGMMLATGDPYSSALNQEETRELKEGLGSEDFYGIGVYIESDIHHNKQLTVIEPIDDSPAAKAGLRTGDRIMSIDGKSTAAMPLEVAAKAIRGPVDSKVTLVIERDNEPQFTKQITRKAVSRKSVMAKMLPNNIAYVRLRYFGQDTGTDCHKALLQLLQDKAESIILDLRNNSGGAVDEAIVVASQFLPKNQLVTTVETPRLERNETYKATGENIPDLPLVVLVNGYSASASEIVAGAMKDTKRATLVGETTFGKGSVQVLRDIGSDLAIKYTIAHYLTPLHRDIHLKGVSPDIECTAPYSNRLGGDDDIQLKAAVKHLTKS